MDNDDTKIDLFSWIPFYMELATKLLVFENRRLELAGIMKEITKAVLDKEINLGDEDPDDIDPFSVFACFNRWLTDDNKIKIMQALSSIVGIKANLPKNFNGIPLMVNQSSVFSWAKEKNDILWRTFKSAIKNSDEPNEGNRDIFIKEYDEAIKQPNIKWNLTMGLFWIRPYSYLNLDTTNRDFLSKGDDTGIERVVFPVERPLSGEEYLSIIEKFLNIFGKDGSRYKDFPDLSLTAWNDALEKSKQKREQKKLKTSVKGPEYDAIEAVREPEPQEMNATQQRCWIFAPGPNASKWDEFFSRGLMGIGWKEFGSLDDYHDRAAIKAKMNSVHQDNLDYSNSTLILWQFSKVMKPGDVVYVKKGLHLIVGRGVVESNYVYDEGRDDFKHTRKVKWINKGEWQHPGQAAMKTLTDITQYTGYIKQLERLFEEDDSSIDIPRLVEVFEPYTKEDFLSDVFMNEDTYSKLVSLLKRKMNIILQGAPGVGKTYVAKKLAYSMIGSKDTNRVKLVQFHQSYSYEDFIMGYRPTENGFEVKPGPFYEFCKQAEQNPEQMHFFIIDEINRGNLSRIFGELLMLIEKDKRKEQLRLLYSDELFSVPENIHIIGMMNTADRSLALIDYALRRRFGFFELEPAFKTEMFIKMMTKAGIQKLSNLVDCVIKLNEEIIGDEALGKGFRIGHSYLCPPDEPLEGWLDEVVEYELIPLLCEYWFDEREKVEDWSIKLRNAKK